MEFSFFLQWMVGYRDFRYCIVVAIQDFILRFLPEHHLPRAMNPA